MIHNIFEGVIAIVSSTITGICIALAGGPVGVLIDSQTQLTLGTVCTILAVLFGAFFSVVGFVWWFARWMRAIEDDIRALRKDLNNRPCARCADTDAEDSEEDADYEG